MKKASTKSPRRAVAERQRRSVQRVDMPLTELVEALSDTVMAVHEIHRTICLYVNVPPEANTANALHVGDAMQKVEKLKRHIAQDELPRHARQRGTRLAPSDG